MKTKSNTLNQSIIFMLMGLFTIFISVFSLHAAEVATIQQKLTEQEAKALETLMKTLESLQSQGIQQDALAPMLEKEINTAQQELSQIEKEILELKRSLQQLEVIHEWVETVDTPKSVPETDQEIEKSTPTFEFTGFKKERVFEVLETSCFACHANGSSQGGLSFDSFASEEELLSNHELWWSVMKNIRSGVMPPQGMPKPTEKDIQYINGWIKQEVFKSDAEHPHPGNVVLRRLNRTEYRNTIQDLIGYDYNTFAEFPPDDTGFGFDTIGEVLSISPMLLEKYLTAAKTIIEKSVPVKTKELRIDTVNGREFRSDSNNGTGRQISFYENDTVTYTFKARESGDYQIELDFEVDGEFDFDPGECQMTFFINDEELLSEHYKWQSNKMYHYTINKTWEPGEYELKVVIKPLVAEEKRINNIDFEIHDVLIKGPLEESKWDHPDGYFKFFTRDEPPAGKEERMEYASELLRTFATKAFRRPVDDETLTRLVSIVESVSSQPGKTFEAGVAQAMIAVIASPRFIYRIEDINPITNDQHFPQIDEYALASRLSYFFWSTMPDEELFALAAKGELRNNLEEQVKRLMKDDRVESLVENFTGQWLQARDVETISIDVRRALDLPRRRRGQPRLEFEPTLRRAMRRETEILFTYIMQEDRSILEMLDSDYTFLNKELAEHYGIEGVEGSQMRKVDLPEDSPYGGVLTQGTVLTVTSNPTRTSPVKRGLYILDNILGTPAPPAPPDVPELEEAEKHFEGREPTLREILELHRQQPLCNSCHARFDPLGLAFENFTAFGTWRDEENEQPIDTSGKLISGETFTTVKELKAILKTSLYKDFYRCLTEKMLTYAIGRGLDYRDVQTVDEIVNRLDETDGQFSTLVMGIIESAPFQKKGERPDKISQSHRSN